MAVTRKQADQVLRQVKERFAPYLSKESKPQLIRNWDWGYGPTPYAIVWEGGPYEWSILATSGGVDEELTTELMTLPQYAEFTRTNRMPAGAQVVRVEQVKAPEGVYLECVTSWALGLFPA